MPVLPDVTLSPNPAYEADTLNCTPATATDADGESVSYGYTWTVDGTEISEASETLDGTWFDRDQEVVCTVTPNDGEEDGESVDSNTVTIENSAPEPPQLSLTQSPAAQLDQETSKGDRVSGLSWGTLAC